MKRINSYMKIHARDRAGGEMIITHLNPVPAVPEYTITPEGQKGIDERGLSDLLNDSIKVLERDGIGRLTMGVLNRDVYPDGDYLRLEYWCDARGSGRIEVGLQGLRDGKGYEEVLVFNFDLDSYQPEWNDDLLERVRSSAKIKHYIPGSWEEDLAKRAGKA